MKKLITFIAVVFLVGCSKKPEFVETKRGIIQLELVAKFYWDDTGQRYLLYGADGKTLGWAETPENVDKIKRFIGE